MQDIKINYDKVGHLCVFKLHTIHDGEFIEVENQLHIDDVPADREWWELLPQITNDVIERIKDKIK